MNVNDTKIDKNKKIEALPVSFLSINISIIAIVTSLIFVWRAFDSNLYILKSMLFKCNLCYLNYIIIAKFSF